MIVERDATMNRHYRTFVLRLAFYVLKEDKMILIEHRTKCQNTIKSVESMYNVQYDIE